MKLLLGSFLTLALTSTASAALDCDVQIGRAVDPSAVCAHFEGIEAGPYRAWYNDFGIESKYTSMVYLQGSDPTQPQNGAAIHWKVDEEYVHIAVAARATGWVAFGIAEAGGMLGADMALFEAAKPDKIVDAYTTDMRSPLVDDCAGDWQLISSNVDDEEGFIMIEFKRLLENEDPQDKNIFNDASTLVPPHRVIAAWGDSEEVGYHGLNRARGAIRFYGEGDDRATFDAAMAEQAEDSFVIASIDHEIAAEETEYAYECISRDDLIAQGVLNTTDALNIIGFEPVIQEGNEAYVHHYIITGSLGPDCTGDFNELVYVWAPGEGPVSLPETLGSPLFGDDGFQAFEIEVHYNNPMLTPGIIDNSGVRVYWTSEARDEQIGILSVGDPNVGLFGQAVGEGNSVHSFECPGSCSSIALSEEPVTVLREYLHMHETGASIVNEQIRNGEVIRDAHVDYWEFDQNGNAAVQQDPFVVQPGDGFRTSCYFSGNGRVFGLASAEEMCMAFLYYHPRKQIRVEEWDVEFPWSCGYDLGFPPCDTSYETKLLASAEEIGREFGSSAVDICKIAEPAPGEPGSEDPSEDSASAALRVGLVSSIAVILMMVL